MSELPLPPVPAACDLRDFPYLPLDVVRLRDSGLAASASGDEFRAAVLLWCASWHQVPAGSLPDDDRAIAHLAGYGRDARGWRKVQDGARRGWFKASDGRLYHLTVAEKAAEAWAAKLARRARTEAATAARNERQASQRNDDVTTHVTTHVTLSKGREGREKEKGEGGVQAPPTPRPIDLLGKALRRRGLAASPKAIEEWSDFLQGACKLKAASETDRALDLILEAAKREGVAVGYSKHAAFAAEHVARTLKAERKPT
jgi:hypothetical protein